MRLPCVMMAVFRSWNMLNFSGQSTELHSFSHEAHLVTVRTCSLAPQTHHAVLSKTFFKATLPLQTNPVCDQWSGHSGSHVWTTLQTVNSDRLVSYTLVSSYETSVSWSRCAVKATVVCPIPKTSGCRRIRSHSAVKQFNVLHLPNFQEGPND